MFSIEFLFSQPCRFNRIWYIWLDLTLNALRSMNTRTRSKEWCLTKSCRCPCSAASNMATRNSLSISGIEKNQCATVMFFSIWMSMSLPLVLRITCCKMRKQVLEETSWFLLPSYLVLIDNFGKSRKNYLNLEMNHFYFYWVICLFEK